jgi:hypothetical protein
VSPKPRQRGSTAARTPPRWLPGAEWSVAVLLTLLALAYHLGFLIHAGALWRDEVNSVDFATMPSLAEIGRFLRYDSFPLLSTLVLRGWTLAGLGHTDFGYRLFGFIVGAGLLASLWFVGRFLGSPLPLFSLALIGLAPWTVRTADSIRPYGLGMILILMTVGLLWRVLKSPTASRIVAFGALAVLSVQCMYQNAFLLLAISIGAGVAAWRAGRPRVIAAVGLAGAVSAVSLLPYVPSVLGARAWGVVVQSSLAARDVPRVLFEALAAGGPVRSWLGIALVLLCTALGVRAVMTRRDKARSRGEPDFALFGASVLIVAGGIYLAAAAGAKVHTQPWYYLPLLALLAPVVDAMTWRAIRAPVLRMARLAIVVAVAGATALPGWNLVRERRTNVDAIASYLEEHASAGDVIVVYPFYVGVTFQRYYRGRVTWLTIPPIRDLRIHRFDLVKAVEARPDPIDPVLEAMTRSLKAGHRVWLVGGLPVPDTSRPPPSIPPAPHPVSGWFCGPYLSTWGTRAAYYLTVHGRSGGPLPHLGNGPVSRYENLTLLSVTGWR